MNNSLPSWLFLLRYNFAGFGDVNKGVLPFSFFEFVILFFLDSLNHFSNGKVRHFLHDDIFEEHVLTDQLSTFRELRNGLHQIRVIESVVEGAESGEHVLAFLVTKFKFFKAFLNTSLFYFSNQPQNYITIL